MRKSRQAETHRLRRASPFDLILCLIFGTISENVQPALFHPKALEAIRSFPKPARHDMGEAILELQKGSRLTMPLSRPMPSIAPGAQELRVRDAAGIYRAFYALKSEQG